jgi:tRNA threonylcarbamoyladenosine biosynthesis protein TsaB
MEAMTILSIDSTSKPISAAVLKNGEIAAEYFENNGLTHSETLMSIVDFVMRGAAVSYENLALMVATNGPGSFTGVRIGIGTVKGLALANNTACVQISSLLSLGYNFLGLPAFICSVLDARCGRIYFALFKSDVNTVERICEDTASTLEQLKIPLRLFSNETVYLTGDGAAVAYAFLSQFFENIKLAPSHLRQQKASSAAFAATLLLKSGQICSQNSADLSINYLRKSQAERERDLCDTN